MPSLGILFLVLLGTAAEFPPNSNLVESMEVEILEHPLFGKVDDQVRKVPQEAIPKLLAHFKELAETKERELYRLIADDLCRFTITLKNGDTLNGAVTWQGGSTAIVVRVGDRWYLGPFGDEAVPLGKRVDGSLTFHWDAMNIFGLKFHNPKFAK